ncbi:hypothetical protein OROHE_015045 [Orobanche hederae]
MASSQTTSFTQKKKETIIDGRLFVKSVVMKRIENEHDDSAVMALVVSCIKQTGLFNLGRQHLELYDESLVEEFYQEASVCFRSEKKGGGVAEIFASIRGVEIRINRHLLEDLFSLPSSGLKFDSADKKVHPSCHKTIFVLPFVYLHNFCCRVVENRTGGFEMCTNLRFRMMVAIMFGEPVNWCQVILKRLQEEVSKPLSQKKSFGLLLTNIFSCLDVLFAINSKKIGPGKFIGGSKPTTFNKDIIPADRPSLLEFPQSESLRVVTKQSKAVSSRKRKHSLSDTAQVEETPEVAQPTAPNLQGATPTEEVVTAISGSRANGGYDGRSTTFQSSRNSESTAFPESVIPSPVRASTPVQDPSPHSEPTPVRDPSPLREPTPVRIPTSEQAPIPVTDSSPTEKPIPVRSPSPTQLINGTLLSVQVEQAFERFVQWKSYRVDVYDTLYHWEDWEEEEKFVLEITGTTDISLLIRWENSFCHELITNFYIAQAEARIKGKAHFIDRAPSSPSTDSDDDDDAFQAGLRMSREEAQESELKSSQVSKGQGTSKDRSSPTPQQEAVNEQMIQEDLVFPVQPEEVHQAEIVIPDESRAIPQEDSVPLQDQAEAERQQEDSVLPVPSSTEPQVSKVSAPHDEALQHPTAKPTADAPASPSSQHMVEIPEDRLIYPTPYAALLMLTGPEEPVIRQESPRSALRTERLEALGHHTVFIQDAVNALHKVGKALDKLNLSAAEEIGGVTSDLYNIANALQVLPQLIKVARSNIQQQKKEIMEKEQAKYTSFAARSAIALKASGTKLTEHDKNLDDLSLSLQTLADKFNRIKGKQDEALDLVQSINSHVSEINARNGEEESREAARRWRLQKEAEIDAAFQESITAAIKRLGASHQGYRVFGHRPEHHDPNVPWKQLVRPPPQINLPTDRQPSPGDITQWNKTQLMRYFVKLIKESTIFDRCKTLAKAAEEFTARLEKGIYPCSLPCSLNIGKAIGSPTEKTGFFLSTSRTKEWPFIKTEAKTLS